MLAILGLLACTDTNSHTQDQIATVEVDTPSIKPIVPADEFDFPVGPPDAAGYYDAQPFQKNHHLGEDWNGKSGGNSDLGDPVHSIAHGRVVEAKDYRGGWGNVVRIIHNIGTEAEPRHIESLYAHLDAIKVKVGQEVRRGEQIGTLGNAHGQYWAHLHLELRRTPGMPLGGGYSEDTTGFLVPTRFIKSWKPRH